MRFKEFLIENAGLERLHDHIDKMSKEDAWHNVATHPNFIDMLDNGDIDRKVIGDENQELKDVDHKSLLKQFANVLAKGDPSKDKKHLGQMWKWYQQGHFRLEDLGSKESHDEHPNWDTVYGTLKAFSDIKNKDKIKDIPHPTQAGEVLKGTAIKNYPDWSDFREKIHDDLGLTKAQEKFSHPDAPIIYNKDGLKVHRIESREAAVHLGKCTGAKWCTGWEGKDNMFSSYNKDGPLYHVETPDNKHYQFHFQSGQFMDKSDKGISLPELVQKHPELRDVPHFKGNTDYSWAFSKDQEEFDSHFNNLIKGKNYQPLDMMFQDHKNPFISPEHIDKALDYDKEYDKNNIPGTNERYGWIVRSSAAGHPKITSQQLLKVMDDPVRDVSELAFSSINHSKATKELFDKALEKKWYHGISRHPKAPLDHLGKILDVPPSENEHREYYPMNKIHSNILTRIENGDNIDLDKAIKHSNVKIRAAAAISIANPEHIAAALKDSDPLVAHNALNHNLNLSRAHVQQIVNSPQDYHPLIVNSARADLRAGARTFTR